MSPESPPKIQKEKEYAPRSPNLVIFPLIKTHILRLKLQAVLLGI